MHAIEEGKPMIIVGTCDGVYSNASVTKDFSARVLVSVRSDGTVIVHNLNDGVRPLCYLDGSEDAITYRNLEGFPIKFEAYSDDNQKLTLYFKEVVYEENVPTISEGLCTSILRCVFDLGGNYGRTTIARILMGSVSKKILTINISKLGTYGAAKDTDMKSIVSMIDSLIEYRYLAYVEDSEFPVLVVTSKGLDVLAGTSFVKLE